MGDDAAGTVASSLQTLGLTYQFHVCAEEIGNGGTVDSEAWKEPASGAQAELEEGTRRFLVRLRCAARQPAPAARTRASQPRA